MDKLDNRAQEFIYEFMADKTDAELKVTKRDKGWTFVLVWLDPEFRKIILEADDFQTGLKKLHDKLVLRIS